MNDACLLDIYGYRALVTSTSALVLSGIREDFAYFLKEAGAENSRGAVTIELFDVEPPYGEMPDVKATVFTPRNVSYRSAKGTKPCRQTDAGTADTAGPGVPVLRELLRSSGNLTFVDYSGKALAIHDRKRGDFRVFSRDPDLLFEAAYLFILSQSGEFVDSHGLHRMHALGVSIQNRAVLVLLPMGGGKSTLGASLLLFPEIQLLSDDSPLIDSKGNVWAFPLRLGLLPGSEGSIPPEKMRTIRRMEFGPKILVNYSYFADRVTARAEPCLLFLGSRSLQNTCTINRASKLSAVLAMVSNCVVGLGLFQGMEFVFQRGWLEVLRKTITAAARLRASLRLIARSEVYHLTLGREPATNATTVVEHMRALCVNKSSGKSL
jgi:hypothetical protein